MPVAMKLVDVPDLDGVSLVDRPDEALEIVDRSHAQFVADRIRGSLVDAAAPEASRLREATEDLAESLSTVEGLWLKAGGRDRARRGAQVVPLNP